MSTPTLDVDAGAPPGERVPDAVRHPLARYLARRLGRLVASVVVLVTAAYLMVRLLPGDPARLSLGAEATAEQVARRRTELGLDESILTQYARFWADLFQGDLGLSYSKRLPVSEVIAQRMPATLELSLLAIVVILVVGVPLGMFAAEAVRGGRNKAFDAVFSAVTGFVTVVPVFVVAAVLILVLSVNARLLPVAGQSGPDSYVLPVAALAFGAVCALARIVRAATLTVLDTDYVRTARAKRMSRTRLYLRHVLPNLLAPTLTTAGLVLGSLVAGSVFVETVFAWPGIGQVVVGSITQRDYPLVQGIVLVYGALILVVNLVVDLLIGLFDPRSRIATV
ncbi:ABC transporter permease [Actinosynnema sp. NPDC047251]|uniref:ABC-type transporter, permease subunit n=1 Tax=Saccharothrix espanaensis (strain ATCC 51144 / DSM 44229 / JCM 9112 / NBRC 15066 / NRRL 15764) TaxID=1179773 RepID=K0JVV3_SACES|nr:ABC transporter permease [Saccharothrix espanaensis]CCH30096.1 ABC-type transporter, permease subunit [Saccharothrix espanaensis DSM 44229]